MLESFQKASDDFQRLWAKTTMTLCFALTVS